MSRRLGSNFASFLKKGSPLYPLGQPNGHPSKVSMWRPSRTSRRRYLTILVWVAVTFLFLTYHFYHRSRPSPHVQGSAGYVLLDGRVYPDPRVRELSSCSTNIDWLRKKPYGLTREIVFRRQEIVGKRSNQFDRNDVQEIKSPLVGQGSIINLDGCAGWAGDTQKPAITLQISQPYPAKKYKDFMFGVATNFDRLSNSLPHFAHWLGNTEARLVAVIVDLDEHYSQLGDLENAYRSAGIDLVVNGPWGSGIGPNEQHFTIVGNMMWYTTADTKWISIIDDDTFFPSLAPVSEALGEFDASEQLYIGGLTENLFSVQTHGFMAYGGAGIFLSLPLARALSPWIESCLKETSLEQGDGLLRYCIHTKTSAEFTVLSGLYQMDMGGDLSGYYESGMDPLSLHHWKSWHSAPVREMAQAVNGCGDCFLQRFRFGNDTLFTNGYSVTVYEDGLDGIDLSQTENTWGDRELFEWRFGPFREDRAAKRFRLVDSEIWGPKLRQIYVYYAQYEASDGQGQEQYPLESERVPRDEVLELVWKLRD